LLVFWRLSVQAEDQFAHVTMCTIMSLINSIIMNQFYDDARRSYASLTVTVFQLCSLIFSQFINTNFEDLDTSKITPTHTVQCNLSSWGPSTITLLCYILSLTKLAMLNSLVFIFRKVYGLSSVLRWRCNTLLSLSLERSKGSVLGSDALFFGRDYSSFSPFFAYIRPGSKFNLYTDQENFYACTTEFFLQNRRLTFPCPTLCDSRS